MQLFDRMHSSLHGFYRLLASGSPGSRLIERDRLTATVLPVMPDRSIGNGVVYDDAGVLADALDDLAIAYDQAGVRAWTVWVPARDHEAAALLERAGHKLDADPAAMAFELAQFEHQPPKLDLEPDREAAVAAVARLNDIAYGYDGDFARAIQRLDGAHVYAARSEGEASACTIAYDHEGDCLIGFVATLPEARGRGLATALVSRALVEARERGCETTSLQATKMGQPVYERLGYRNLGLYEMWERRRAD